MKFLYTLCIISLLSITDAIGQDYESTLKNQDFATLEALLTNDVTVKVAKEDKVKGKAEGIKAIRNAISTFNPTSAKSRHNGKSVTAESDYVIVNLQNADGDSMRVFVHLENSTEGKRICDIKIR